MPRQFSLGLSAQQLRTINDPRAARAEIRFEAGRRVSPFVNAFGNWRGLSGRRYYVKCIPLCLANAHDLTGSVAVGASIDSLGKVSLVGVTADCVNPARWLAEMAASGATELHVHSLCAFEDDRAAIVADLTDALGVREAA